MRLINNIRGCRVASGELTVDKLTAAEKLWLRSIQASSFKDEARCLSRMNEKETILVQHLDLFKDQENVIHCRSQIDESSLSLSEKQPILLLRNTPLLILDHHKIVHHTGKKETLNSIRETIDKDRRINCLMIQHLAVIDGITCV